MQKKKVVTIFSDWIKSLERQGVKLYEIADVIDVTYQTVQCYRDRNNFPTVKNLIRLSEHYDISIEDMLYYPESTHIRLTESENMFLEYFRNLSEREQAELLDYLKSAAEKQKKSCTANCRTAKDAERD